MKCPHCLEHFVANQKLRQLVDVSGTQLADNSGAWFCINEICPGCKNATITVTCKQYQNKIATTTLMTLQAYPKTGNRPVSPHVPADVAADFVEACLVLADSPKASAALSRRCLQHLFHKHLNIKKPDLAKEIQEALDTRVFQSHIAKQIDDLRHFGNFGAHPIYTTSGEIVDVEPGEAEAMLDLLESIFDFLFINPAIAEERRKKTNATLTATGATKLAKEPKP